MKTIIRISTGLIVQQKWVELPGVYLAEALDRFLISLVFIVFSIGVVRFFLQGANLHSGYDLLRLRVESFSSLKFILWEMLLKTLFVFFATELVLKSEHFERIMFADSGFNIAAGSFL
jgi:hypothetical protein